MGGTWEQHDDDLLPERVETCGEPVLAGGGMQIPCPLPQGHEPDRGYPHTHGDPPAASTARDPGVVDSSTRPPPPDPARVGETRRQRERTGDLAPRVARGGTGGESLACPICGNGVYPCPAHGPLLSHYVALIPLQAPRPRWWRHRRGPTVEQQLERIAALLEHDVTVTREHNCGWYRITVHQLDPVEKRIIGYASTLPLAVHQALDRVERQLAIVQLSDPLADSMVDGR